MSHTVGVAKAARILGVSRVRLQNMIRGGDLHTFEGLVDLDELKRYFPALALTDSTVIERTQAIRENAYGERVKQRVAPNTDSLQRQIKRLKVDLNVEKAKAQDYKEIFADLLATLSELQQSHDADTKRVVGIINQWLVARIENKNR